MDNYLTVKTADGKDLQIMVLNTFSVDEFPNKQYIAYTFGEFVENEMLKSYISILNEKDNFYTLEDIKDQNECNMVKEAYENMLLEGEE